MFERCVQRFTHEKMTKRIFSIYYPDIRKKIELDKSSWKKSRLTYEKWNGSIYKHIPFFDEWIF